MDTRLGTSEGIKKGCKILLFAVLVLVGLIAVLFIGKWARGHFWQKVPATILSSELRNHDGDLQLDLRYHYEFEGKSFTGTRLEPGVNHLKGTTARKIAQSFQRDMVVPCHVNPSAPGESYLKLDSLVAKLVVLIFPLFFITVGIVGIVHTCRAAPARAIAHKDGGWFGTLAAHFLPLVFILMGGGGIICGAIYPWFKVSTSSHWRETPCIITLSRVESRSSKHGANYHLEIAYLFAVNGQSHIGDRYDFGAELSESWESRKAASEAYPAGRKTMCFVNPNDPADSVLIRQSGVEWMVLAPVAFLAFGVLAHFGIRAGGRRKRKGRTRMH